MQMKSRHSRNVVDILLDLSIGELSANQTLGSEESVFRVHNGLTLGRLANQALALLGEGDNRWSGAG